jgi:hypothetical protein
VKEMIRCQWGEVSISSRARFISYFIGRTGFLVKYERSFVGAEKMDQSIYFGADLIK